MPTALLFITDAFIFVFLLLPAKFSAFYLLPASLHVYCFLPHCLLTCCHFLCLFTFCLLICRFSFCYSFSALPASLPFFMLSACSALLPLPPAPLAFFPVVCFYACSTTANFIASSPFASFFSCLQGAA
jgi:hypothetical protein